MKNAFLILIITTLPLEIYSQVGFDSSAYEYAQTITSEDLSEYLNELASDKYEGRETGKKGQKLAAEYISSNFKNWGLLPVGDDSSYFQKFELFEKWYSEVNVSFDSKDLGSYEDYMLMNRNYSNLKINSETIFLGYGKPSDYENVDVKNKVVVLIEGYSKNQFLNMSEEEISNNQPNKVSRAYKNGASFVIIVPRFDDSFEHRAKRLKHWLEKHSLEFNNEQSDAQEHLYMPVSAVRKLFNMSEKKFYKMINKCYEEKKIDAINGASLSISHVAKNETINTENVVGMIEGSDKKDEIIVLSAHYDHIGIKNDLVFNGADDDGSGTVSIMEMAQAFAKAKQEGRGPRRSILIIGMTGEEKGLLGSEYYSEHPIYPLNKTVVNLNTDMVGRLDEAHENNENYVYLIGSNMLSKELHEISESVNKTYKNIELDYTFNKKDDPNRFYYRSDHYNFAKNGIPVIFYFNGVHEDYHKATDTVDKILFNKIENIAQLIFYTAWEIANKDERVVVD